MWPTMPTGVSKTILSVESMLDLGNPTRVPITVDRVNSRGFAMYSMKTSATGPFATLAKSLGSKISCGDSESWLPIWIPMGM